MKLRTRIAVVITAVLALGVLAATPAQASYDDCNWGTVCVYTGLNGSGSKYTLINVGGSCHRLVGNAVNNIESYANRRSGSTSHHVQFYDGPDCNGALLHVVTYHGGPIPSGAEGNFEVTRSVSYRNRTESVWFNNG